MPFAPSSPGSGPSPVFGSLADGGLLSELVIAVLSQEPVVITWKGKSCDFIALGKL